MKYMEGKRGGKRRSEDEGEVLVATSLTWMVLTTFSQLYTWRGHLMILVWVCILHTDTCPIGITSIKGRSKTIHKKLCVAMVTGGGWRPGLPIITHLDLALHLAAHGLARLHHADLLRVIG